MIPCFPITPFHVSVPISTCALKNPISNVNSVGDTRRRASFTSSTKAWCSFVALGARTYNKHNDRSNTLSFSIQIRDPKGIQSDTQSNNRRLLRIPTPAWADILGSAPEQKSFYSSSRSTVTEPCLLVEEASTISIWYRFASSINSSSFPVKIFQLSNSSWWWLTGECATLPRVRILCTASMRLSKRVASSLVNVINFHVINFRVIIAVICGIENPYLIDDCNLNYSALNFPFSFFQ